MVKNSTAQKQKQNAVELVGCVYSTRNNGDMVITKYVNKNEVHVNFIRWSVKPRGLARGYKRLA